MGAFDSLKRRKNTQKKIKTNVQIKRKQFYFKIEIMSCLKSSHIYYLDLNSITDQNQDVAIRSGSGGQINLNKLFLLPFSPLLKSIFSNIVEEEICNFTI